MTTHRFLPTIWHNVLGTVPAALHVENGDTVVTETIDANGWDRHDRNVMHGPNPMNGPIHVAGAKPGDTLKVEILDMTPNRATGWTRASLATNVVDPDFVPNLPEHKRAIWRIDHNARTVRLEDPSEALRDLVIPLAPMIGCFGVAPAGGQAISTATSAEHGGNMDYRRFGPGATAYFPVAVDGALFFLGDCHAVQGDGEIVGTGVETSFDVTVRLSVEQRSITWPRGENAEDIFTIGNARPLDQALQHATTEMVRWLGEFGLDIGDASHLLGQTVRYDIGNVFDPAYTVACRLSKKWLSR
ncbi:MAG: acetamidase/formamidase family protein [Devosia sp.]